MSSTYWYLAAIGAGLGSYLLRVAPFIWRRCLQWGKANTAFLTYVSFAIAAGIVSKVLFLREGELHLDSDTLIKCLAVVGALGVHRLTGNTLISLFAGVTLAIVFKTLVHVA